MLLFCFADTVDPKVSLQCITAYVGYCSSRLRFGHSLFDGAITTVASWLASYSE